MRNAKGFSYLCQSCRSIDVLGFVLFAGVVSFSVAQLLPVSGKNVNNIAYLFIVLPTLLLMVIAPAAFFDRLKHALPLWIFLGTVFVISIAQGANGFARPTVLVFFLCAGIFNLLRIRPKALVQVYGILACVAAFSTFPVIFEWFSVFLVSHTTPRLALSGHARNPIYAGLLVVSSLSFCWFILLEHQIWLRSRIRYVLAQGITFVLCLLSVTVFQSRSALLGLLACFIIHWSQNRFLKHAAILVIVSALALWAAGLDGAIVTRGLSYRPEIWWDALTRLGQTCNVFIGCGHTDEIFLGQYKGSHSAYVGTLLRHGLIGGFSFLVFGVWFFRRGMRTRNSWFLVSLVGWGGMLTAMDGFIGGPNAWWVFFWIPTAAAIHANANPFESRGDFDKQESDVTKSQESGKSGGED